jgi:hypothetical protein
MFENFTNEEFDDIVDKFYFEIRQQNGDKYQRSSLFSIRYGLNRHLSLSRNVDIMDRCLMDIYFTSQYS